MAKISILKTLSIPPAESVEVMSINKVFPGFCFDEIGIIYAIAFSFLFVMSSGYLNFLGDILAKDIILIKTRF